MSKRMAKRTYGRWTLDPDAIVGTCLARFNRALRSRSEWLEARVERHAKLRGWLPDKDQPPWEGASDAWLPMLAQNSIRLKAQLYNTVLANHPVVSAKARQRVHEDSEEAVNQLLDWQLFHENPGEQLVDDFISNFVDDGTAFAFVRWVREEQRVYDVRVFPPPPAAPLAPGMRPDDAPPVDPLPYYLSLVEGLWSTRTQATAQDAKGLHWRVTFTDADGREREGTADIDVLPDGRVELLMSWLAIASDGPAVVVDDLEDVVFPPRVANLQPPSAHNPKGAPWVYRRGLATIDAIRRRKRDGTYDLLDDDGMTAIEASAGAPLGTAEEDRLKDEKDAQEGMEDSWQADDDGFREIVECYERWDIDHDGFEEDVIFWIAREARQLLRVRLLSALYPGVPIRRPLAEARFITIPGRVLGVGLLELLESLFDLSKIMLDQAIDGGTLRNLMFFFYRASSGLKPEPIRITPGEGYPLDNPQQDVYFPQLSGSNEAFYLNMLALMQTFGERLTMIGDLQLGRVPTGKASALRTTGTTMALLGQGDVRGEQILRRLFHGMSQVYELMHRLNRRFLPAQKEIRIAGVPKAGASAYLQVNKEELDADVDFEFSATLLNTNRQLLSESLLQFTGLALSPLLLQMGITTPEQVYRLVRDLAKARDLDPDRYLTRPDPQQQGEALSAEEALGLILQGVEPEGYPLEGPLVHLQRLQEVALEVQDQLIASPMLMRIFQIYVREVQAQVQQAQQQAQLAQMAAMGQGGGGAAQGPGGVPTTVGLPPQPAAQPNRVQDNGGQP